MSVSFLGAKTRCDHPCIFDVRLRRYRETYRGGTVFSMCAVALGPIRLRLGENHYKKPREGWRQFEMPQPFAKTAFRVRPVFFGNGRSIKLSAGRIAAGSRNWSRTSTRSQSLHS